MNKYLAFLLLIAVSWTLQVSAEPRALNVLLAEQARKGGKRPKGRDRHKMCEIEKPKKKCESLTNNDHPFCLESKPCKFVPEYGYETSPLDKYFEDHDDDKDSFLHYLYKPKSSKGIYKILDLGEDFVPSFHAKVCKQPNKICECGGKCKCNEEKHVKTCTQQYRYEYGLFLIFNTKYCEPKPWYYHLLQGAGGHGSINPYLLYLLKDGDGLDKLHPLLALSLFGQGQGGQHQGGFNPYLLQMLSKEGGFGNFDEFFPLLASGGHGQNPLEMLPYLSMFSKRHYVAPPSESKPPHPSPEHPYNPQPYPSHPLPHYPPPQYPKPHPYPGQTPHSPYPNIPFWALAGGHGHQPDYVPCDQKDKPHLFGGINFFNWHQHKDVQVDFRYLKVKVPNGCQCEK